MFLTRRAMIKDGLLAVSAGKTTAIRLMLGILKPDSGEGRVGDFDLRRQAESISTLTGYVSQRFSLYGELTVEENLELFADLYAVPKEDRLPRLQPRGRVRDRARSRLGARAGADAARGRR